MSNQDSVSYFTQVLAIYEELLGPEDPYTATSLNNLASLYMDQGKYTEAEALYRRALAICEEQLGPQHPDTAFTLNNLAALYENQGRDGEAEPMLSTGLRYP